MCFVPKEVLNPGMNGPSKNIDWLIIGITAFLGGIVSNIVVPSRRGLYGFVAAGLVGVFCGFIAGVCANEWGASLATQILVAASFGVLGDRIISHALNQFHEQKSGVNVHIGDNNSQSNDGQSTGWQGGYHDPHCNSHYDSSDYHHEKHENKKTDDKSDEP